MDDVVAVQQVRVTLGQRAFPGVSRKHKPRVFVVGAGFAGTAAAKAVRSCDADVTPVGARA